MDDDDPKLEGVERAERSLEHEADELEDRIGKLDAHLDDAKDRLEDRKEDAEPGDPSDRKEDAEPGEPSDREQDT
jgi:predicted  nucleic acid-binding Zn-ribbon protein